MPISVVCVVGAFRTGKSFALDLFLRYLRHTDDPAKSMSRGQSWGLARNRACRALHRFCASGRVYSCVEGSRSSLVGEGDYRARIGVHALGCTPCCSLCRCPYGGPVARPGARRMAHERRWHSGGHRRAQQRRRRYVTSTAFPQSVVLPLRWESCLGSKCFGQLCRLPTTRRLLAG